MIRPIFKLDWDDCVAPFNSKACELATAKYGIEPALSINDIDSWENTGRAACIKEFYADPKLYEAQSAAINEGTKASIRRLTELGDVFFSSAVYSDFMTTRAKQIKDAFPEIPDRNILLGGAKELIHADISLDDNIDNVLNSPSEFSVLMRKPWNSKMTGVLSVNDLQEFVLLVEHILQVSTNKKLEITEPTVVALVGPSGSGKNDIADYLCYSELWKRPKSYTNNPNADIKHHIYVDDFKAENYIESTRYAGYAYGTREEEVAQMLESGSNVVIPLDMCGAIGMKKRFPTVIMYIDNPKEKIIRNILDCKITEDEKVLRILSLEAEKKNATIADVVVDNENGDGGRFIENLFENFRKGEKGE